MTRSGFTLFMQRIDYFMLGSRQHSHNFRHRYSQKPEAGADQPANSKGRFEAEYDPHCHCTADKQSNPPVRVGFCSPNAPKQQRLEFDHHDHRHRGIV